VKSQRARASFLVTMAAVFFSVNGIVAKWVMEAGLSPWRLTEIRATGAGLILFIYLAARGRLHELKATRADLLTLLVFGSLGIASVQSLYFFSILHLHVSIAIIIQFTAPIWIVLYLRIFRQAAISPLMWTGLISAFTGLLLVSQIWQGLTLNGLGLLASFGDALSLVVYFLLGRSLSTRFTGEAMAVWGFGITALIFAIAKPWWSFPHAIFSRHVDLNGKFTGHHLLGWVLILFVIFCGTVIPYTSVLIGVKHLSAQVTAVIGMLEPVLAGIWGWIFLHEKLSLMQLIGTGIVLIGIYISTVLASEAEPATATSQAIKDGE
jgi:drug/metabolite transporter (DMT)-like permease